MFGWGSALIEISSCSWHTHFKTHTHTQKLANTFKVIMDEITVRLTDTAVWATKTLPCCQRQSKDSYLITCQTKSLFYFWRATHTLQSDVRDLKKLSGGHSGSICLSQCHNPHSPSLSLSSSFCLIRPVSEKWERVSSSFFSLSSINPSVHNLSLRALALFFSQLRKSTNLWNHGSRLQDHAMSNFFYNSHGEIETFFCLFSYHTVLGIHFTQLLLKRRYVRDEKKVREGMNRWVCSSTWWSNWAISVYGCVWMTGFRKWVGEINVMVRLRDYPPMKPLWTSQNPSESCKTPLSISDPIIYITFSGVFWSYMVHTDRKGGVKRKMKQNCNEMLHGIKVKSSYFHINPESFKHIRHSAVIFSKSSTIFYIHTNYSCIYKHCSHIYNKSFHKMLPDCDKTISRVHNLLLHLRNTISHLQKIITSHLHKNVATFTNALTFAQNVLRKKR